MKKILAGLMAAATVASVAMAADGTATATSANAVGFISIPNVDEGELICITIPFVKINSDANGGEMDIADLQFATDAEFGSIIYTWGGAKAGWKPNPKRSEKGEEWEPAVELHAGQAVFFKPSEKMDVILAGQVPADPAFDVDIGEGAVLEAIGNPYPTPLTVSQSSLGTNATFGSIFYRYDANDGWKIVGTKRDDAGEPFEDPDEDNPLVFQPGEGFFLKTEDFPSWEAAKPYTWP